MERAVLDWQDLSIAGFADGTYVQLSVADWLRLGGNVERAVAPPELDNRSLEESSSEYTYSYSASGEEVEIEEGAAPSPLADSVIEPRAGDTKRARPNCTISKIQDSLAWDPESQRWHGALAAELASRPRHQARACLSWLRNGQWKEIASFFDDSVNNLSESAKAAVNRMLDKASQPTQPTESIPLVKTLASRFSNVSNEIACPAGCKGPTRYGHRVGDLSKYVAMERDIQLTAVLAYCPACHLTFDAHLNMKATKFKYLLSWACLLMWNAFAKIFAAGHFAAAQYVARDPVRINYTVPVRLKDGREVNIVTRSDFSTGLPVFEVQELLTREECMAIRSAAPPSTLEKSLTDTDDTHQPISVKKARMFFKDLDVNHDKALDMEEISEFFLQVSNMVDFTEDFLAARVPNMTKGNGSMKVKWKEFIATNWNQVIADAKELHPEWFSRHSSQTWLEYSKHSFLQKILDNVAAVTGLSESLVRKAAESMQVLLYPPHGGHYSCHHDTAVDSMDDARFMTVFFFLNDVTDGGETVLFGTDLNGTFAKERAFAGEACLQFND
eukprot:symbB.v1.2.026097.t1/scaffold2583.1/size75752/6